MRKIQNVMQLQQMAEEGKRQASLSELKLKELIPLYAVDKASEKNIKETVKMENDLIKGFLRKRAQDAEDGKASETAGGWVVTLSIEDNSSMNEEKLIEWLKQNGLQKGIVKKKEYVDEKALENAIYNEVIPKDKVAEMDVCREPSTKEVLRIAKAKEAE